MVGVGQFASGAEPIRPSRADTDIVPEIEVVDSVFVNVTKAGADTKGATGCGAAIETGGTQRKTLLVERCVFDGCAAEYGGAICAQHDGPEAAAKVEAWRVNEVWRRFSTVIRDSRFVGNSLLPGEGNEEETGREEEAAPARRKKKSKKSKKKKSSVGDTARCGAALFVREPRLTKAKKGRTGGALVRGATFKGSVVGAGVECASGVDVAGDVWLAESEVVGSGALSWERAVDSQVHYDCGPEARQGLCGGDALCFEGGSVEGGNHTDDHADAETLRSAACRCEASEPHAYLGCVTVPTRSPTVYPTSLPTFVEPTEQYEYELPKFKAEYEEYEQYERYEYEKYEYEKYEQYETYVD